MSFLVAFIVWDCAVSFAVVPGTAGDLADLGAEDGLEPATDCRGVAFDLLSAELELLARREPVLDVALAVVGVAVFVFPFGLSSVLFACLPVCRLFAGLGGALVSSKGDPFRIAPRPALDLPSTAAAVLSTSTFDTIGSEIFRGETTPSRLFCCCCCWGVPHFLGEVLSTGVRVVFLSIGLPISSVTLRGGAPKDSPASPTLLRPSIGEPEVPGMLRSTATKLARTLDSGLPAAEWSDPAGERPRDGGEVDMLLTLLFSNFAKRPRTPVGADMAKRAEEREGERGRGREQRASERERDERGSRISDVT